MRISSVVVAVVVLGMTLVISGATRKVNFSGDAIGQPPKGFEFGHSAKTRTRNREHPTGWRARETYVIRGPDELEEVCGIRIGAAIRH
ncbi:MAG: hypothetical protein LC791_11880 [Acidobacteria bacterium]|nr:hypothetical protein [Acidobacteriota bacterium]